MRTVIIDYDSGNLHSAAKAFERMAAENNAGEVVVSSDPKSVLGADRLVLPGDGAFPHCKQTLDSFSGLSDALRDVVEVKQRPFLGICVGMQLLATWGREYQDTAGLGWISGEVVKIKPADTALKVPHMGWNDLMVETKHPVLRDIKSGDHAYFVHSYKFICSDENERLAHVDYAGDVTAIVGRDNIVGTQFHPEKSQETGLRLIGNFLGWRP